MSPFFSVRMRVLSLLVRGDLVVLQGGSVSRLKNDNLRMGISVVR